MPGIDGAVLACPGLDVLELDCPGLDALELDGAVVTWSGLDVLGLLLGLGLAGGVVAGGVVAGGVLVGPGVGAPGVDAAGVVGFGLVDFLWLGLGLPAGLPQSVELARLALAPPVPLPLVPLPLEVALPGPAGWLAASWSRLESAGLEVGELEVLGLPDGLVPVALGVAAGLVPAVVGVADGLVLTGRGLATGLGWAFWCLPAATAGAVCGEQVAAGCPPPALLCPVPFTPTAPLPGPDAPDSPVPADPPPPPIELMSAAASANICLPNGVSTETLIARTNVTAATAATRRPRASGRRGVPGRSWVPASGLSTRRRHADCSQARADDSRAGTEDSHARTEDSHTDAADSPIPASLAASERADMSHATGAGRGVVSRDRIRSRLSSESSIESTAECSARRKTSS